MVIVIIIVIIMIATVTSEIKSLRSRIRNTIFKNFFFSKKLTIFSWLETSTWLKNDSILERPPNFLSFFYFFFLSWCSPLWSFLLPASTKSSEKSERKKLHFKNHQHVINFGLTVSISKLKGRAVHPKYQSGERWAA